MKSICYLVSAFLLFAVAPVYCETTVSSKITPLSGSTRENFSFSVTVSGTAQASPPLLSGGSDFILKLIGPQSSVMIVNGSVTSSTTYVYRLTPKKAGTLLAPIAEFEIDGRKLITKPLEVIVSEASAIPDDGSAPPAGSNDEVFLRQDATPKDVYLGQQVVNAVTLYTRVDLRGVQLAELSSDGFWQEGFGEDSRSSKTINGADYSAITIKKALYPLRSGVIEIPIRQIEAQTISQRPDPFARRGQFPNSPFDQSFFDNLLGGDLRELQLSSNPVSINVKPLPSPPSSLNAPLGSVTIVGATSIRTQYSVDLIRVGESKKIVFEVTSEGNLNPLKSLTVNSVDGIKVYEEGSETKVDASQTKLKMHRFYSFSFVATKAGLVRIPGAKIAFFNPITSSYEVASSPDIAFVVDKEVGSTDQDPTTTRQKEEISDTPRQIEVTPTQSPTVTPEIVRPQYVEPTRYERFSSYISLQVGLLCVAIFLSLMAIVGVLIYYRKKRYELKKLLTILEQTESPTELHRLLISFLTKKLMLAEKDLSASTNDQLRALTNAHIEDRELELAIRSLLDDFELMHYGNKEGSVVQLSIPSLKLRLREVFKRWSDQTVTNRISRE